MARASLHSISGLGARRHSQALGQGSACARGDSIQWPSRMPSMNITSAQPREVYDPAPGATAAPETAIQRPSVPDLRLSSAPCAPSCAGGWSQRTTACDPTSSARAEAMTSWPLRSALNRPEASSRVWFRQAPIKCSGPPRSSGRYWANAMSSPSATSVTLCRRPSAGVKGAYRPRRGLPTPNQARTRRAW